MISLHRTVVEPIATTGFPVARRQSSMNAGSWGLPGLAAPRASKEDASLPAHASFVRFIEVAFPEQVILRRIRAANWFSAVAPVHVRAEPY